MALCFPCGDRASAPTLEERLSESEFKAYGLDKLTPAELKGLNAWLHGEVAAKTADVRASDAEKDPKLGFRARDSERAEVKARLQGTFTGWSGQTVFKLDNGQEWKQVEPGSYSGQRIENAEVTIKPKMMGNWLLVVEYCQCRIGVTRIK